MRASLIHADASALEAARRRSLTSAIAETDGFDHQEAAVRANLPPAKPRSDDLDAAMRASLVQADASALEAATRESLLTANQDTVWGKHCGTHIDNVAARNLAEFCVGHELELTLPVDFYDHSEFPFDGPRRVRVYDTFSDGTTPLVVAVYLIDLPLASNDDNT